MTVKLITTIDRAIGLSSDSKPTSVRVGSTFFEYNTRTEYITYDGTNWVQHVTSGTQAMQTSSDPAINAAVSTAIVDAYSGVIITLTAAGNTQTIQDPTITTAGKIFTVVNNDTSTDTIAVNGITLGVGDAISWIWDGTAWAQIDLGITSLPVPVTQGGTEVTSLTDHGVLVGSGTSPVTVLSVGTNGQVLVGSSGADPVFATITDGEGIDTTLGAGTLTIACETASDTNQGVVELATDAEAIAGTDTARAITASNLKAKLGTQTDGGLLVGAGTTAAVEALAVGATTEILVGGGAGVNPVWTTATGSDAPVRATSPVLVTPALGTPSSGTLTSCDGLPPAGVVGTAAILGANNFTASQDWSYATVASHATASAIWAALGNVINFTGTETITDFPAADQAGAQRVLICAGACVFTHGGSITVQGGATYTASAGDFVLVTAISTTTFKVNIIRQTETGTGSAVMATSPTLVTPALGTPASGDLRNCDLSVAPAIGDTTPAAGTFKPLQTQVPVAITSFAGTASRAGNALTFTSAADAIPAGYDATNPILGTTVVLSGNTMIITSWTNSTTAVVGTSGTIAGATPTSVQAPYAFGADNASPRVLVWAVLASKDLYVNGIAGVGSGSASAPSYSFLDDPDTGMYSAGANSLRFQCGGSESLDISSTRIRINAIYLNVATEAVKLTELSGTGTLSATGNIILQPTLNLGIGPTSPIFKVDVAGGIYSRIRSGRFMFDDAPVGTQLSAVPSTGLLTLNGTNYAAANLTVQADGAQLITAAADNDSAYVLIALPSLNTTQNPQFSFRFKVDDITNTYIAVGLVTAAYADKAALPDDMAVIGIDADNGHGFGAARLILTTNDTAAGADYDDLGSNMANNTWVWGKVDLTDTEQPRVFIAGTEIAAGSITGTVKDATAFKLYIHLQNLAGGAKTLTVVNDFWTQDQPA